MSTWRARQRVIVLGMVATLVAMAAGCGGQTLVTFPPTTRPPEISQTPVSATAEPATGSEVETAECEDAEPETVEPQPYLAEAPEQPRPPGAGQPEEDELNEGRQLVTPIDPDAVIAGVEDVGEPRIPPLGAQDDPLPNDVVTHRPITSVPSQVSHIAEPNVAVDRQGTWLMTWNWGAARSFDGGVSISYMNPWDAMLGPDGNAVDGGFCCDQLAHYVAQHDLWVWVLQSNTLNEDYTGGNRIRLALATGRGAFDRHVDLLSTGAGLPDEVWFDQPKIGASGRYLFLSVNAYSTASLQIDAPSRKQFVASVVYRLSLDDLASGGALATNCFTTLNLPDLNGRRLFAPVPVRQATDTMYLGAHYSNSALAVWRWPDASAAPTMYVARDVGADGREIGYPLPTRVNDEGQRVLDYRCAPAGTYVREADWCQRSSDRISSAWISDGLIGFAWNAGQNPATEGFPYPWLWITLIDETRLATCAQGGCVVARPGIRSTQTAYQYASVAPNAAGDLGLVILFGGGEFRPSCRYAIHEADAPTDDFWNWSNDAVSSSRNAFKPEYGDYLNIWPGPTDTSWTAACMTIETSNRQTPGAAHFLTFGRRSDQP